MVREITTYPTTPSLEFGANVRFFNDELYELIQDLKDTIDANNLDALAAFQIGSSLSVIVVKNDDEFIELINASVLKRDGKVEPTESTAYFPGLSAKTTRYEKIKVMYEDRGANQQFLEAEGDLAITIQRKIDYTLGSNFRVRMSEAEKDIFDSKLQYGTDAINDNGCPTVFKRDRILQAFKALLLFSVLMMLVSFFVDEEILSSMATVQNYTLGLMSALTIIYFFYAQYEGKEYKQCTSCQIGNIIGTTIFLLAKLTVLAVATYFIF